MADQTFNVNSGFYNAVDSDRTYYAEDMNRPYKRLVANGVFATPAGTVSTDLAVSHSANMDIIVAAGEGIFADKWFENPSDLTITVPAVTTLGMSRIDSVLVQIDERSSGRVGSIVYRTGTESSSSPSEPAINSVSNVTEYRVANVNVNKIGITSIDDLRGTDDCPWVTALIQQVDTDALFEQYRSALETLLADYTTDFEDFLNDASDDWNAFIGSLSSQLTVTPNIVTLTSSYTTTNDDETEIPIQISSYDSTTDILLVFINGCMAKPTDFWNASSTSGYISLVAPTDAGNRIDFVCFKSVITAATGTVTSLIDALDSKVDAAVADSGWSTSNIYFYNGSNYDDNHNKVQMRKYGEQIFLTGAIKGVTAAQTKVFAFNLYYVPAEPFYFSSHALDSNGAITADVVFAVNSQGELYLYAVNGTIASTDMIPVCASWLRDPSLA